MSLQNELLKKFYIIKTSPLFADMAEAEIEEFLFNAGCHFKTYEKNEIIFTAGSKANKFGIILSGLVFYYREDFEGNRNLLLELEAPITICEVFPFSEEEVIVVNVMAKTKTEILYFDTYKANKYCEDSSNVSCHKICKNLIKIIVKKYLGLTVRAEHLMRLSLRKKIMSYLSEWSMRTNSNTFEIPLNRQELADYLYADRSAVSAELSKMQKDGIITYKKNYFEILIQKENKPK